MNRRLVTFLAVLFVLTASNFTWAQLSRTGLISHAEARQFGLHRAWHTQIQLDRARGRVAHMIQHISSTKTETVYQVVTEESKFDYSERAVDRFGQPLGSLGTVEMAAEKVLAVINEIKAREPAGPDVDALTATEQAAQQVLQNIEVERQKHESSETAADIRVDSIVAPLLQLSTATPDALPKLVQLVIPDITLFVLTDQGVIHAINGHTGRTRWVSTVGRPEHPNMTPAANDQYLAVVNGSRIYILESDTGKLIWQRVLSGAPGAGPALTDDRVFIPMISGKVEIYQLFKLDELFQFPSKFASTGRGLVRPTATSTSVGWPTDRGYFYVADSVQLTRRFRLEANDTIVSPATYMANLNQFLVASIDGYAYAVHDSGTIVWRFSAGDPVSHSPIPIGNSVYVITDNGGMYRVAVDTGQDEWWTPQVRRFIGASENRIYCADHIGRMMIIDAQTGGRLATIPATGLDLKFINSQTDRLFVGTTTGMLMCLHETQLDRPLFHVGVEIVSDQQEEEGEDGSTTTDDTPTGGTSPFGGGAPTDPFGGSGAPTTDPFGGGSTPTTDPFGGGSTPADPFGGSTPADPFGGGSDDKPADPFGGTPNPFG